MLDSVRSDDAILTSYDLLVDGVSMPELLVRRIEVDQEVNKLPRAYVTIEDGDAPNANFPVSDKGTFKPGSEIELKLGYIAKNKSVFKGIILGQRLRLIPQSGSELIVICGDKAEALNLSRGNRCGFDVNDADAIQKLASNLGLEAKVEGTSAARPSQVQNDASDWDFILMRARSNGWVVTVADGTLTIGPPGKGTPELMAEFGNTITAMDLSLDTCHQIAGAKGQSWDPKVQEIVTGEATEPDIETPGKASPKSYAKTLGDVTPTFIAQSPEDEVTLKTWAEAELLQARLSLYRGTVTFAGTSALKVGTMLSLEGLGGTFNGTAYIGRLEQHLEGGDWVTRVHLGLAPDWFCPAGGRGRSPLASNGLQPGVSGLQIAKVLKTDEDPDGQRRIQVSLPLNDDTTQGLWVRLAAPYASKDFGFEFLPEVGDEVVLGFLDADPDAGIVLGSLHSSVLPSPLEPDPENTKKSLKTRSGLTLSFDDEKAILTVETPGGHKAILDDEATSITLEDSSGNKVEMTESGLSLSSPADVTISATGSVSITGTAGVTLKSDADVGVAGLNTSVKGELSASLEGGASAQLTSSGEAKVQGTMVMIN